jgi:uncharacterized protein YutE (UPF0331/DUF86 family)/predicted nucleotidyltransferase
LFGSHATGRAHRQSDVDVGVLLDWNQYPDAASRFDARVVLATDLPALLGSSADVVILNDAPPGLGRAIVTAGVRVCVRDAALDHAFVRDVQLRAADLDPWLRRMRQLKLRTIAPWTWLVERLAELKRHLDHLEELRPRIGGPEAIERDLSLHNDVLFSLMTVCQLVIDVAGELSGRRGQRFEDYTQAIRSLSADPRFPVDVVHQLVPLAGFRNIVIHEYVALDMQRVVEALRRLAPVRQFLEIAAGIKRGDAPDRQP